MRVAELVWEGKYDFDGKKVGPVRIALPFQTVETVNASTESRRHTGSLFAAGDSEQDEWRNRLIWGDKKYVLPALLPEFAGKVDLIYIDPPYMTGSDFSFKAIIPVEGQDEGLEFKMEPSAIEKRAYGDTWGKGSDTFLQWFYETTSLLQLLLSHKGTMYVHLDPTMGHYAKAASPACC